MEIRVECVARMEDSDSPSSLPHSGGGSGGGADDERAPPSPCDSEISVGCEADGAGDRAEDHLLHHHHHPHHHLHQVAPPPPPSPMDMTNHGAGDTSTEEDDEEDDEEGEETEPHSPSTSRGAPSPTLSSASLHTESFTYLSDDDYFRPLKRLAMSGTAAAAAAAAAGNSPPGSHQLPSAGANPSSGKQQKDHHHSLHHQQQEAAEPSSSPSSPDGHHNLHHHHQQQLPPAGERGGAPMDEDLDRAAAVAAAAEGHKQEAGLRSFSILDILSYKPSRRKSSVPVKIVRPWDTREDSSEGATASATAAAAAGAVAGAKSSSGQGGEKKGGNHDKGGALDALFKMTNKTLDNLNKDDKADSVNLFNSRQPPKKKRKSRTAFTNHQIFELEKRFLYQKYLSPADRDELAQNLGLSNAQVITWFQNRRAKLKRDMEELKRDVECTKVISSGKALLEASVSVAALLKNKDFPRIPIPSLPH